MITDPNMNTITQARLAIASGFGHEDDGLDAALEAVLGVIRTRVMEQRVECRAAGRHDAVDALTDLLAELD